MLSDEFEFTGMKFKFVNALNWHVKIVLIRK